VALVLFFLPPLARTALTASLERQDLKPVVAGVFDAFSSGLRTWALVLAGMGLVLASAASSFASHVEVEEIARRVWTRLQRPARSFGGELVRSALLLACGLVAALRPTATLQTLTVLAGAILAFEGLRELFMLVPPRVQRAAREAEQALTDARERVEDWQGARTLGRYALVGALALAFVGAGVAFIGSRSRRASPTPAMATARSATGASTRSSSRAPTTRCRPPSSAGCSRTRSSPASRCSATGSARCSSTFTTGCRSAPG
jgi:hypothetical protein